MDEQNGTAKMRYVLLLLLLSCTSNKIIFDNGVTFQIELAETQEQRAQGLMYREKLDADKGMLFTFPDEQIRTFWMRNTIIPLDIIFIDENKTVVEVYEAQPCTEEPCTTYSANAQYTLEINGGLAKNKSIVKGSTARIN